MTVKKSNPDSEGIYHFDNFFNISADFICIAGFDGFFKRINPAVSKLLGFSEEELYARPISSFVYTPDLKITIETREQVYKNKPLLNFENRYLTKSGEIVWLSWTSMPVESEKLVYAIAKNITHKKKVEEERNLLLANLTQINKELTVLSHKTSHDLKSPINNMLSVFSLIDVSKINDPETLELINILKLTSENLKETLNESIDELVENENINTQIEEINLTESLAEVLASINSLVSDSKAIINVDFSAFENVTFNKAYIKSIFLNLLTNSIKYSKPHQVPVITIQSRKNNGVNQLIFSDNGLGFDMDKVKDKIFGLYEKFHSNVDSNGIGLYLVYNHITSLGGRIAVESKINEGATFTISFKY
ncbi:MULTISPECIES: PAS domain-containing sensor histidine kinase [unclassified Flavobacterium]|jgi:PAS domain S-box-containing protein|uniref:PAS domain-containing sensor histidine kinase n=1 Tax=unclassified Flavobacterium TaxID=196869 RepID=UPI000C179C0A|nr:MULTISPECIES: PAS domain-containing sensor histidine kinase [unclassified Flavobacterium]MDI6050013.1 PAS domain-containing sensor histidine kinase [Flavobacterium sp. XS2P24]PIF62456.1 PAS domain S-box-containing protein [Flavobacterium sp. 11]WKL43600.1 PAS domain-containing sensor histidine kinase [Flavobacterium sp. ZE23DGlu08]